MRRVVTGSTLFLMLLLQSSTGGQTIVDVPAEVNRLLAGAGQVRKVVQQAYEYQTCVQERCVRDTDSCRCVKYETRTATRAAEITEALKLAGNLELRLGEVTWQKPFLTGLPTKVIRRGLKHYNCTPNAQSGSVTLTANWQSDEQLQLNTTVGLTDMLSLQFTYNIPTGAGDIGTTLSGSRTWTTSTSETRTATRSQSFNASETIPRNVSPFAQHYAEIVVTEDVFTIPFSVPVVVDGLVDSNLDGYTKVSQVIRDPKPRTFVISGFVRTMASSDTDVRQTEVPLDKETCVAGASEQRYDTAANLLGMNPESKGILDDQSFRMLSEVEASGASESLNALVAALPLDFDDETKSDAAAAKTAKAGAEAEKAPSATQAVVQRPPQPRLFRANGRHSCQSRTDIGHTCSIFNVGFSDCTQAHAKLRMQDCCPSTRKLAPKKDGKGTEERFGGKSIGYIPGTCTPI